MAKCLKYSGTSFVYHWRGISSSTILQICPSWRNQSCLWRSLMQSTNFLWYLTTLLLLWFQTFYYVSSPVSTPSSHGSRSDHDWPPSPLSPFLVLSSLCQSAWYLAISWAEHLTAWIFAVRPPQGNAKQNSVGQPLPPPCAVPTMKRYFS